MWRSIRARIRASLSGSCATREYGGNTTDFPATAQNSSICDAPLAYRDSAYRETPIDSIFVVSPNREDYQEGGYLKNSAKMQPQKVLVREGDTRYLQSVAARFGGSMRGGPYVAAFATPPGDFMAANDSVLDGPMSIEEARGAINSEPLLLICPTDRPPGP